MDQRLKNMMKELGDAINNSLSDSDQIADVISRIKADGYDVLLVLEATIGFSQRDEDSEEAIVAESTYESGNLSLKMTSQDTKFLKSLRIKVEDSE